MNLELIKIQNDEIEEFIRENQRAFYYGAVEEFGLRDEHFEEDNQIISRKTIIESINTGVAYNIMLDGINVGGIILKIDGEHGDLDIMYIKPEYHSKGIGTKVWQIVESMYTEVKVWETMTPYFEKRNIHFYVNRCGFHIIEFFNYYHKFKETHDGEIDEMFRFRKEIK